MIGPAPSLVALAATLACVLEASAEKVGNVTPTRSFPDLEFPDFVRSALALGPAVAEAQPGRVGWAIWRAVSASRRTTRSNTHLGVALLFAPIAAATRGAGRELRRVAGRRARLRTRLARVLRGLSVEDARWAYRAIRAARPGGLGRSPERPDADVLRTPRLTLLEAMRLAAARDSIAGEYARGFPVTFDLAVPALTRAIGRGLAPSEAIAQAHLELLGALPDSLIARKAGRAHAQEATARARRAAKLGGWHSRRGRAAVARLDRWLRQDGHRLNPGTTADLIAAALFVWLLTGR